MGNGTCQEPAKTVMGAAPIVIPQSCPMGTTDMGDGTCQEPAKTVMGAAPIVIPQPCPSGTLDLGNGTCEAPAQIIEAAPIYTPAPAPVYTPAPAATCPSGSFYSDGTCLSAYEGGRYTVPDTVVTDSGTYCYGDGKAMYDSNGHKIKGSSHAHSTTCRSH